MTARGVATAGWRAAQSSRVSVMATSVTVSLRARECWSTTPRFRKPSFASTAADGALSTK